jgi:hypothetical protein
MADVLKGEYSMTCVFLGDEGSNCANSECNKHWGDNRAAKICPHCGHTDQMWWASWVEKMRQWQASGQKGYFVYNASVKLGPGQRTEKQYLDDNGLEYEEVSVEQFHLIRRPDRKHSVMALQHNDRCTTSSNQGQMPHEVHTCDFLINNPILAGPGPSEGHALSTTPDTARREEKTAVL